MKYYIKKPEGRYQCPLVYQLKLNEYGHTMFYFYNKAYGWSPSESYSQIDKFDEITEEEAEQFRFLNKL